MTKILTYSQIQQQKYANPQDFYPVVDLFQRGVAQLHSQNIIQGATNYGSFLDNRHTELSDIDAVILNQNPIDLINSQAWQHIVQNFANHQIDFTPVIVRPDDILSKRASFSFMQPLKNNQKRWHIGQDPVDLYFQNYSLQDQVRSLTVVISDYNRQFIEPLIYNTSLVSNPNLAQTTSIMLSGFKDSYRNLINIHSIQSQADIKTQELSFANFKQIFPDLMSSFEYRLLENVDTFQAEYLRRLDYYFQNHPTIDLEPEYNNFLNSIIVMAPLVIKFIHNVRAQVLNVHTQLNINHFN